MEMTRRVITNVALPEGTKAPMGHKYFFVSNPINRYSISARQNLKANPDGSTDLCIQKARRGPTRSPNWLPAPAGKFILMLRMYWPNENSPSIINGSWKIPAVRKQSA